MKRWWIFLTLTACLLAATVLVAQPPPEPPPESLQRLLSDEELEASLFGPETRHPEFDKAVAYLEYWDSRALDILRTLADEHRGELIEAAARITLADNIKRFYQVSPEGYGRPLDQPTRAAMRAEYQRVVEGFPLTQYYVAARRSLLSLEDIDVATRRARRRQMVIELTGVDPQDVLEGKRPRIDPALRARVPRRYYNELAVLFDRMQTATDQELLYKAEFVESNFPRNPRTSTLGRILTAYYPEVIPGQPDPPEVEDTGPPVVTILSPTPGQRLAASDVLLDIEMHEGDATQGQISLENTRIELDGVDILEQVTLDARLSLEGPVFERFKATYRPGSSLSVGPHQLRVLAVSNQTTERVVTFEVIPPIPVNLSVQVVSKHVKPRKNESLVVDVASNRTPVHYTFSIYRQNCLFAQYVLDTREAVYRFTWAGVNQNGVEAHNGVHDLEIRAVDPEGNEDVERVQFNVNMNQ
ncbi:MAG: hypothetical protein AB1758_14350 [Candidatus Eremiobacterota bacterium]